MSERRPRSSGLALRIMRTTLLISLVTMLAVGGVALVSTGRLSSRQTAGEDLMTVQLIEDRVSSRLNVARISISRLQGEIVTDPAPESVKRAINAAIGSDTTIFESVSVATSNGTVLASSSEETDTASLAGLTAFEAAKSGQTGFRTVRPGEEPWQLWLTENTFTSDGEQLYIVAELSTDFVRSALTRVTDQEGGRIAMLVENDRLLSDVGRGPDLAGATWSYDSENSGRVVTSSDDGSSMQGLWVDLADTEELQWRLVVMTPLDFRAAETWQAVMPSIIVLLVAAVAWTFASRAVSVQIVRPLKELERAARVAATGTYVRPIAVHADDEVGRVAEAFNQVSLRLNSLHDLSQLLATTSQIDQVLDGILSAVDHLVGPGVEAIYLLDEPLGEIVPVRVSGIRSQTPLPVSVDSDSWLVRALYSSDPLTLSGDVETISAELPGLSNLYGHALGAPLVSGSERLGVVVVLRDANRPLTDAEKEMVRTFSTQAAVAVQTSRLFAEESRSRQVSEALRMVAQDLVRPGGLEPALRTVEDEVNKLFAASSTSIVAVDPAAVSLKESASPWDAELLSVAMEILGTTTSKHEPRHVERGYSPSVDGVLDRMGGDTVLVIPVALESDHGAVMVITGPYTVAFAESVRIASAVADEVALALDNAYFYKRALTRATTLETIFRISQAVGSSLQVNVVLNRVLDVVQKILSADAVALLQYDEDQDELATAMARGDIPPAVLHLAVEPGEDVPGQVFASGQPTISRNLHEGMPGVAGKAAQGGMRSMLAVPLMARGRPIGILMVFSKDPSAFVEEDVSMLQTFATQAALAIDTAQLYGREHEVSTVLQRSILPEELPRIDGLTSGSVYAPAGSEAEIGGDYYDLFKTGSGDTWFAIADVCGKGVVAATKTSMIRYALRAFAAAGLSPAGAVAGLNDMVSETDEPSDIVTIWVGRLDPDLRRLTWADGGHPPGLLRRADGSIEKLDVTGPLLGALSGVAYEESAIQVGPGDCVLLYTDGVTEARQGNIFFGEERVREVFAAEGSADRVAQAVLDEVKRYTHMDLRDDVAVLAIGIEAADDVPGSQEGGRLA